MPPAATCPSRRRRSTSAWATAPKSTTPKFAGPVASARPLTPPPSTLSTGSPSASVEVHRANGSSGSYRTMLIPYHNGVPCGRESHETVTRRTTPERGPGPGALSNLLPPGREGALAGHLAVASSRLPAHPGPASGHRRPVGHRRPPRPPPLESAGPRRAGRPPPRERSRPAADPGSARRPPLGPAPTPARQRAVVRPEGGALRPRPMGRVGLPADRLAVAAG